MKKIDYTKYLPGICTVIALCASTAQACSVCVIAQGDRFLPPIHLWCLIAISWFLLTAVISSLFRVKIDGVPKIIVALILVIGCVMIGAALLGYLSVLPFVITPAITFIRSFSQKSKEKWGTRTHQAIQVVGFVATAAVLTAAYLSYQTHRNRSAAQYIIQWDGTGPSMGMLYGLKAKEPESLAEYRYIVDYGEGFIVADAGERIAAIGDPANDTLRLEAAIKRARDDPENEYTIERLERSLQELQTRTKKE